MWPRQQEILREGGNWEIKDFMILGTIGPFYTTFTRVHTMECSQGLHNKVFYPLPHECVCVYCMWACLWHMQVCVLLCTSVCIYRSQRKISGVLICVALQVTPLMNSQNVELGPCSQPPWSSCIHLPKCWCTDTRRPFTEVLGIWTKVFMLMQQVFLPSQLLPQFLDHYLDG